MARLGAISRHFGRFAGDRLRSVLRRHDRSSLTIPGRIASLEWIRSTLLGVLGTDGELYRYDVGAETLTKVADDVKSFYPAADGSAIAALESNSIEIFSLTIPADQGGYYRFNLPDMGSVKSLAWYHDDSHLFVVYPTHGEFPRPRRSFAP